MVSIACIGCSWTSGVDSKRNIPYPKILYHLLKEQGIDATVYNFGIGGSGTKIHKAVYEWANENFKLDFIVHQITDHHRIQITSEGKLNQAFVTYRPQWSHYEEAGDYLYNNDDNYFEIKINKKDWAVFPVLDFMGLPLEKPTALQKAFFKDDYVHAGTQEKEFKMEYDEYFAKNPILTFKQFMTVCKYRYHYERATEINELDTISDIDHIINHIDEQKRLTFFWRNTTLDVYKDYKKKHKQKHKKYISMVSYFESINKKIENYSFDKWLHLNTEGNEIVAKYIMKNLKKKGII